MKVAKSFRAVCALAAVFTVVCSLSGILIAVVAGTPVDSTIVAADIVMYLVMSAAGGDEMKSGVQAGRFLACAALVAAALLLAHSLAKAPSVGGAASEDVGSDVDLDFTRMNQTVRTTYSYRLDVNPKEFDGKALRLSGTLLTRVDKADGKRYFACQLGEPGGCSCCTPGGILEFEPKDGMKWPEDFPPAGSQVTITGRLGMVEETDGRRMYVIPRLFGVEVSAL